MGENIARAIEQGYTSSSEPYHGYFFKILKGQGPAAPLGEMDFVVKGALGPKTLDEFNKMERFNPDRSWTPVPEKQE